MLKSISTLKVLFFIALLSLIGVLGVKRIQGMGMVNTVHGDVIRHNENIVYISKTERIPEVPEVERIKATIETGWRLRLQAGLDRNKDNFDFFKEQLGRFYSERPSRFPVQSPWPQRQSSPYPEKNASGTNKNEGVSPLLMLPPGASELEKQLAVVENGRLNEERGNFRVVDFGVKKFDYKRINIRANEADVIVDIVFWSKFKFENPDGTIATATPTGGEQHTFHLVKEDGRWKIDGDTFIIIPGYEP